MIFFSNHLELYCLLLSWVWRKIDVIKNMVRRINVIRCVINNLRETTPVGASKERLVCGISTTIWILNIQSIEVFLIAAEVCSSDVKI